ncbi:sulfite exporter TauE/SafE family protein [Agrobacterium vitis]|uniref:sulfite exporter TauE/SafE family protein n=1 Tax=Agrobacterium vitis TaxID=373 RepID=UPI001571B36E|nr:sulfite exporter TauE/SafE family protein [Agrobacterium vitis]NSZ18161.1 sulfite exporter TauE/SafE family protein [Agrobacterium vitis]QZO03886.1 sulfite exporter TauE/SafE family protein [Agrobacterium vitis]UJL89012.1 sulfite exporter TauE/SafE family protein [Agrobacterium vitis]BCH57892.1 UPF0721 transmembrane protein [Agrobacterium vitis]
MSIEIISLMFVAGFFSAVVNAIAGGGTFLTFGVLTLAGLPSVTANATSSIIQFPGYITSTLAYRREIAAHWKSAALLSFISAVGSLVGALILISLSNPTFSRLVPWLLLMATLVFALGPRLRRKADQQHPANLLGLLLQGVTSVYGGFFGAGMGIMMLASLQFASGGDYHHLNALKNLLAIVIAAIAILVFATAGAVSWLHAGIMLPAAALGGYAGVHMAKRAPQTLLRWLVIAAGLSLAIYYFFKG